MTYLCDDCDNVITRKDDHDDECFTKWAQLAEMRDPLSDRVLRDMIASEARSTKAWYENDDPLHNWRRHARVTSALRELESLRAQMAPAFTWEDVDFLRQRADEDGHHIMHPDGSSSPDPDMTSIADRIAALLPRRS